MTFCAGMYSQGSNGTKAAALATSSQMIAEFCVDLNRREAKDEEFNDALTVFQYVISKLDDAIK